MGTTIQEEASEEIDLLVKSLSKKSQEETCSFVIEKSQLQPEPSPEICIAPALMELEAEISSTHFERKRKSSRKHKVSVNYLEYMSEDELKFQNMFGELGESENWIGEDEESSSSDSKERNRKLKKKIKNRSKTSAHES